MFRGKKIEADRTIFCFALPLLLLQLAGCTAKQEEPASPIIQAAEQAGSGDLTNSSTQAMEQWLGKHRPISDTIEGMCKPVRQTANAQWADSTEGRLCSASHDLAFFRSVPVTGDGKTFRLGNH